MPHSITTTLNFHAAHQLRLYDGSLETLHEHDWGVKVTVSAPALDSIGVVMDFHDLAHRVKQIVTPWQNLSLNNVPAFANLNPSAENVALHIARSLDLPPSVTLTAVEVWETPENSAVYQPR